MKKQQTLSILFLFLLMPLSVATGNVKNSTMLFAGKSCGKCEEIKNTLTSLKINFKYYNVDIPENFALLVQIEKTMGKKAIKLPVLVHGNNFIGNRTEILKYLNTLKLKSPEKRNTIQAIKIDSTQNTDQIIKKRFTEINTVTIAIAGLIDGINPCAFATIAFLVGCLTSVGRSRKKAIAVGLSFSVGVFITYFAVGLGLFHSLYLLNSFNVIRNYFHITAIAIFIIAGTITLFDAFYTSRNNGIPLLKLPDSLRKKANHTIARGLHTDKWIIGGFGIGVSVSLLEFACTGQIYVPTIIYMINTGTYISKSYWLFTIYNFMFIVPLLLVLYLCIKGFEVKKLWDILKKRAALSKTLMSMMFFMMALLMWI